MAGQQMGYTQGWVVGSTKRLLVGTGIGWGIRLRTFVVRFPPSQFRVKSCIDISRAAGPVLVDLGTTAIQTNPPFRPLAGGWLVPVVLGDALAKNLR